MIDLGWALTPAGLSPNPSCSLNPVSVDVHDGGFGPKGLQISISYGGGVRPWEDHSVPRAPPKGQLSQGLHSAQARVTPPPPFPSPLGLRCTRLSAGLGTTDK